MEFDMITDHTQSTKEVKVFTRMCDFVHGGGGQVSTSHSPGQVAKGLTSLE